MGDKSALSVAEKKKLTSERQRAVREAWGKEKAYVANGEGTRDWTPVQQREIMEEGRAESYEGHHMKNVSNYPEQAGNPDNIQFLDREEHIQGAHQGNTHTQTNGYFNPDTKEMEHFKGDELRPVESAALTNPSYQNGKNIVEAKGASAFNASAKNASSGASSSSEEKGFSQSHSSGISR